MSEMSVRWVQLDVARQIETIDFIEKFITLIADSGYNGILLYLEDRIKTDSYQLPADNEAYSTDEIKHLVKFATGYGIELIPCVATLGHAERFLRHKELEHFAELQGDTRGRFGGTAKNAFCVTHPKFYDFIGNYLKEIAELFPSKWFHIGMDEFWDYNICSRCRKAMPTLQDEQEMFLNHVLKIREILAGCGKRIMLWSDMFEFYPNVFKRVPSDVVMVDWQYQQTVRNYQGHLLDVDNEDRLAINHNNKFETIVAPHDRILNNSQSYFEYAKDKPGVLGGLLTSWEKNDTFLYRSYPVFIAGGLQLQGMTPDDAFDAMMLKLFGIDDKILKSVLKIVLNNGLFRHFEGVSEDELCCVDYFGRGNIAMDVDTGMLNILESYREKICTPMGRIVLEDLLDALCEKNISNHGKLIAQSIFDKGCTPELKAEFDAFRLDFSSYLDHMARRWKQHRSTIKNNLFSERKSEILERLDILGKKLSSNTWIKFTGTLPDYFGVENIKIELKVNGKWQTAATGVYKSNSHALFHRYIPLENEFTVPIEAVRLSACGLGGVGINFLQVKVNGKLYVPAVITDVKGKVNDPVHLLCDNTTFAWFGGQSTRHDYFDRNSAGQIHTVTLGMREADLCNLPYIAKN